MQTECLVRVSLAPLLEISVRFLHPLAREIGALRQHRPNLWTMCSRNRSGVACRPVYQSWQEAVERTVAIPSQPLRAFAERSLELPFSFPSSRTTEPIGNDAGQIVGLVLRRQEALQGRPGSQRHID